MRELASTLRLAVAALFVLGTISPAEAAQSVRTYLDGTGATKQACTGTDVPGAPAAAPCDTTGITAFDVNGNPITLAQDGTDASGVSIASGGAGIRGWLSTIAGELVNTLKVQLQPGSNLIGAVTQSGGPWTTSDAADGAVIPGSAGTKSLLAGLYYSGATLPSPSAGQQVAAQSDGSGRLLVNTPLTTINVTNTTPTVTIGTYAARQSLGGLLTFSGALPTLKGSIEEVEMLVANGDTPVVTGTLYLFDTAPSGGSTISDHTTVGIATADMAKIIAAIPVSTIADASGANAPAYGSTQAGSTNSSRKLVSAGSSTIWGCFVMNSATVVAGASDVTFRLKTLSF